MVKYKLLEDRFESKAGSVVYKSTKYDYGCASDDTSITGIYHISVSLDETGDYPFFTVPFDQLEEI